MTRTRKVHAKRNLFFFSSNAPLECTNKVLPLSGRSVKRLIMTFCPSHNSSYNRSNIGCLPGCQGDCTVKQSRGRLVCYRQLVADLVQTANAKERLIIEPVIGLGRRAKSVRCSSSFWSFALSRSRKDRQLQVMSNWRKKVEKFFLREWNVLFIQVINLKVFSIKN